MTTADITLPSDHTAAARAQQITQNTAVEQSRAVAEVQAAVMVAQSVRRDEGRAEAEMVAACGRMSLAEMAFYSMPRSGGTVNGPTIHLAREIARIWGNVDYGVRELRRDDEAGESEIQAYAWDQQNNVRSIRTFIVPHARMVGKGAGKRRERITDIADIYLNNQNIGARAVRECIFAMLPRWYTEKAQRVAHETLRNGEGKPLAQRVTEALAAFRGLGITEAMIEAKIRAPRSAWTAGDVANLGVLYTSIQEGSITKADAFPTQRVSPEELVGAPSADTDPPNGAGEETA